MSLSPERFLRLRAGEIQTRPIKGTLPRLADADVDRQQASADAADVSPIATALREAQEEVAIDPRQVRVLGQLPPVDSNSGFQVTSIVGLLAPDTHFVASEAEVAEIFEIPLTEALSLASYTPLDIKRPAQTRRVYFSWYRQHMVWDMTAQILYRLGQHIRPPIE